MIQILEDLLRSYMMDFSWFREEHLLLVEFTEYQNDTFGGFVLYAVQIVDMMAKGR